MGNFKSEWTEMIQATCERTIQLCQQRHLWGYWCRTRTLKLTQTLFLTLTRILFLKENKNISEIRSFSSILDGALASRSRNDLNTASKDKRNSVEKDGHNSAMHSRSSQSKREYETGFQNGQKNSYCVCQLDKIDGSDDDLARRYKYYRLMTYTDSSSLSATFHGHNQVRIHPFATTQHTPNRNIYCTFLTKTETAVYISRHSEFNSEWRLM